MTSRSASNSLRQWLELLRWHKPSGRLILLIPAGWSLWLIPNAPPTAELISLIAIGGLMVSGAGCIANDLWDRRIDRQVERTRQRPLAKGSIRISTAVGLLLLLLLLSLLVVVSLPTASRGLCLGLAVLALPPILLYPSAKRWFAYPQAVLALCWGFAVLIPWAASQANLSGGWPLIGCWLATLMWTFGFDTVYAMADRRDDANLALKSSALSLGSNALKTVALSYALACTVLATAAVSAGVSWTFWPFWLIASIGMQKETWALRGSNQPMTTYGQHFQHQVLLGAMLLIGLILGRIS
ncbi:MAG: 4-hydroxybenzoate polyprenyltransferase [Prochlorococcus sp.]|nr:4-hydroxybenzoate polyprenyltransferase [Prochlorococcaceae cyanobacterium Fu_MAG_134]